MPSPDFHFDGPEDAELRVVPVPEGLLERLRGTALARDADLDAAIRDVPVPAGLPSWFRQPALQTDEGLDAALREVPVSAILSVRLRQVPKGRLRLNRMARWAAAASLLMAIGLSYFGAMIGFLISASPYAVEISPSGPISAQMADGPSPPGRPDPDFRTALSPLDSQPQPGPFADSTTSAPRLEPAGLEEPRGAPLSGRDDLFGDGTGGDLFLDVDLYRWGLLTAHRPFDDLPELRVVSGLIPRGIDWPLVEGSNRHILIRYGVHPFVSPASHPQLCGGLVPLGVDSSSYELTRRYLESGKLPPPDVVRTEEFLAAADHQFPRPKEQSMGLVTAAGPSPFGNPGLRLMQIGVQARELQLTAHQATYLILAVDVSASMRWGGRLAMIRGQLGTLLRGLGPKDRISLVVFSEDAHVLAEEAGPDDADRLLAVTETLWAEGSTNVGAGLREAYGVARRGAGTRRAAARLILLTDGLAEFPPGTRETIQARLADAVGQGIILDVIDLRQEKDPDPQLASFARAGGGKVHRATNADQLRWALLEIITGQSQLVATDARLKVTFNPKGVLEYRLLGHEAKAAAGLMPAHPEAGFHAGQAATALYEIRLRPGGGQEVAQVELTWRDPGRNQSHRTTRSIQRGQFGSSFVKAPLSLQAATLLAEAAEILRQSPYAISPGESPSRGLSEVLHRARQVDTQLSQRPSFAEFVSLLETAEKAKPYRGR